MPLIKNAVKRPPLSKQEIIKCLNDFAYFCERCLLITDKNGKKVPLKLNKAQRKFADFLMDYVFAKKPIPKVLVILKARQMGYTTVLLALEVFVMIKFMNNEYESLNIKHFLHLGSIVSEIVDEKLRPMIENLHPSFFGDFIENKKENKIACVGFKGQRRNNKVRFHTARSEESGRGGTAQVVILDEAAFYSKLNKIQAGVASSLPSSGLSLMIYVSTANGFNGFYDMYQLAKTDPNMESLFLPWFLMEEYVLPPDNVDPDSLLPYEEKIIEEMYKWEIPERLHLAKIAWYRDHLVSKKGNDLALMRQEFPSTEDEPFTSSDAPVFPAEKILSALKTGVREPIAFGRVNPNREMVEGTQHDIKIFSKPVRGRVYNVTIDPAFGGEEADYTSIRVNDSRTLEDAAVYATKAEPEDVADIAIGLANYYNRAYINVENNRGELLMNIIRNNGYGNFYYDRRDKSRVGGSKVNIRNWLKFAGTRITATTKTKGINRLRYLINTGKYMPFDQDTLQELLHFNYVGEGGSRKAQAVGNKPDGTPYHDDLVMGLVNWALALPPQLFGELEQNEKKL